MRYLPQTDTDLQAMLQTIGVASVEALFTSIPKQLRNAQALDLPEAMAEPDLVRHLTALAAENATAAPWLRFLGAGCYAHYTPAWIGQLLLRGEFLTPYSPYQPEVSQGTLQVIFEYQSMICELLGMEVSNASMYDASTATAEAVLMAQRVTQRSDYVMLDSVHPEYRAVTKTIAEANGKCQGHRVPYQERGGIDMVALDTAMTDTCAACVVQYPSVFGTVEDVRPIADCVHQRGALLVVVVPDPIALGLIEAPGMMGADIVVAEGQALGNPMNYGGPGVGVFATRQQYVRQMPGRLSGMTTDADGMRGFVLALATREQFIRRERATSNICTNQQLAALATTMYLAWLGKSGLQDLARINWEKAQYAKTLLTALPEVTAPFALPTFHEFVIRLPRPAAAIATQLREQQIEGGVPLGRWYPSHTHDLLVCVTEQHQRSDIDRYVRTLQEILAA